MKISARVTEPGEPFTMGEGRIVNALPGEILLHLEWPGNRVVTLLSPEDARAIGLQLVSEGAKGLRHRYGPVEALKRVLTGKSMTPYTEGDGHGAD